MRVASLATGELFLDDSVAAVAPAPTDGVAPRVAAAFLDSYKRKDDSKGYRCLSTGLGFRPYPYHKALLNPKPEIGNLST